MKALKIIGIVLLVLIVIVVAVVYMQPSQGHVEKSIVINAPASAVFKEVNSFKSFNEWSPWAKMDSTTQYAYEGPATGVGAKMSWDGETIGKGSQWIEESVENQRVKNGLSFGEYDTKYSAEYMLEPEGDNTKITWVYDGPNEGFGGRMMWLFMEGMLNEQYEQGLTDLKALVESKPAFSVTITEESVTPIHYVGLSHTMSPKDGAAISAQMGTMYGKLMGDLQKAKVNVTGAPFCLYPSYSEESMDMVCALPVPATAKLAGYTVTESYGGPVVKAIHAGDYNNLEETHNEVNRYIASKELQISGAPWETYVTDPMVEKDTSKWITEIYYPVSK